MASVFEITLSSLWHIMEFVEGSFFPVLALFVILVILEKTKPKLSTITNFQIALAVGSMFLYTSALSFGGRMYGYFDFTQYYLSVASGVCGLGISSYSFRLTKLRGVPAGAIVLWVMITCLTILVLIWRISYLYK